MNDQPSDRLVDQRMRNRIMEAIETLVDGDEGVRREGPVEYFESFYDWIPHRDSTPMRPSEALTTDEQTSLRELSQMLDDACDDTRQIDTIDGFIASGWPKRVQPIAVKTLDLMRKRGRFSEEHEEETPSQ